MPLGHRHEVEVELIPDEVFAPESGIHLLNLLVISSI